MAERQYSIPMPDGHRVMVDCFGGDELLIEVGGKTIRFEFSERFGPMALAEAGGERRLGPRHPFWRAVSLWQLQGSRVEGNKAVWHEPKEPVLKQVGARKYLIVEDGEPGHDW